jgi:hypothetical protein
MSPAVLVPDPAPVCYDEVPYKSHAFHQTHLDRLATVATLLGLTPPRPERCRVLELACAGGGNLIPMAESFPRLLPVLDPFQRGRARGQRLRPADAPVSAARGRRTPARRDDE